jgi:hypothetical protein
MEPAFFRTGSSTIRPELTNVSGHPGVGIHQPWPHADNPLIIMPLNALRSLEIRATEINAIFGVVDES